MFLVAMLVSAAVGWVCGGLFGLAGLFISVPVGIVLGFVVGELNARRYR